MQLFIEVLVLSLVLSVDSFSAALAMGFRPFCFRDALRFALASGGAEGGITVIGFLCGKYILALISAYDHWVAFGLLLAVSMRMIWESISKLRQPETSEAPQEFHGFAKILLVSVVTSLDALGVGLSLGVAEKPIAFYAPAIGVGAVISTFAGLYSARRLSAHLGPKVEIVGGLVLLVMSFQMLKI